MHPWYCPRRHYKNRSKLISPFLYILQYEGNKTKQHKTKTNKQLAVKREKQVGQTCIKPEMSAGNDWHFRLTRIGYFMSMFYASTTKIAKKTFLKTAI